MAKIGSIDKMKLEQGQQKSRYAGARINNHKEIKDIDTFKFPINEQVNYDIDIMFFS